MDTCCAGDIVAYLANPISAAEFVRTACASDPFTCRKKLQPMPFSTVSWGYQPKPSARGSLSVWWWGVRRAIAIAHHLRTSVPHCVALGSIEGWGLGAVG